MKSICCIIEIIILTIIVNVAPGLALRSDLATKVKDGLNMIAARSKANSFRENQSKGARQLAPDCCTMCDCFGTGRNPYGPCVECSGPSPSCNMPNPGNGCPDPPTEAPTETPTKAPTKAPTASYTPELTAKGQQCAAGHAIDIKDECETAIQGATWKGEKASRNRPFGCFLVGNKVFYNPIPVSKRKVWKGSKAICKGGDFVAALAAYTSAKKGKNCADGEIVDKEDDCKAAANELGNSYKKSVNSKTRPAGCFNRGNKVWFNIRTTVYTKGRFGKFTGVCKVGN